MEPTLWYKDAVFYQIYVRAFRDSNGDGRGDIQGLTQKLDYLEDLGVDCIWLMPIYPSPLKDDGYDIADYYNIAEAFGTLEDFKSLIKAAHAREIRVIMDGAILTKNMKMRGLYLSIQNLPTGLGMKKLANITGIVSTPANRI